RMTPHRLTGERRLVSLRENEAAPRSRARRRGVASFTHSRARRGGVASFARSRSRRRGDASSPREKTRRHLVLQLEDEATPRPCAGR
ncbi:hypothetical protein BHE74_00050191, partial [Ensete ventricosum]